MFITFSTIYKEKYKNHTQSWSRVNVCMRTVGGDLRRDRHEIRLGMFPSLSIQVQDSRSPGSPTKYNSLKRVTLAYVKTEPSYIIKGHNEPKYLVYIIINNYYIVKTITNNPCMYIM